MATVTEAVDEFVGSALFTWVESCLPNPEHLTGYPALLDGTLLQEIWLQIDPEPQHHPMKLGNVDELGLANARAKNFDSIVKNIKNLFEEELDQTLLVLPDCSVIGNAPTSRAGLDEMKLLLTLLLGAAVQCPNKEFFIAGIKELDLDTQHAIVELIKQVTDNQTLVLTNDSLEHLSPERMYQHIIRIARERDKFQSSWISSLAANEVNDAKMSPSSTHGGGSMSAASSAVAAASATATDNNHLAVELADLKSKLRRFRQELEEKSEAYMEVKEDLEHTQMQYEKLRTESQEWYTESRLAAAYRDEVDVLQERAERANRLEVEVQRFREKLSDSEFFKARVEELREDNRMLLETKEMLEEQLQRSRRRSEHAMALETEIIKYKQSLNDMALERDADKSKLQELMEENTHLLLAVKQSSGNVTLNDSHSDDDCASGDNSLSEQLTNNAQTRVLKLELENRRLQQSLDTMNESSFHENATKLLDSEKEKKRLSLKVEQLQENCNRMTLQNKELEDVFRNALDENKKLQDALDQRQQAAERQMAEREVDRMKFIDTEKRVETLIKEKQRIQTLSESIQRRADDLERTLATKTKVADQLQKEADRVESLEHERNEAKNRAQATEKENVSLARDVAKLRENLEQKDVLLDKNTAEIASQTKELAQAVKKLEEAEAYSVKIIELETINNELVSQNKIDEQTIATLQKDLVEGTLVTKRVQMDLERLGIDTSNGDLDSVEINVESVVSKLVKNPETFKTVKEIMLNFGHEQMQNSDMCVLCHKKEIFTVEKNIEISGSDSPKGIRLNVSLEPATNPFKEQCELLTEEVVSLRAAIDTLQSENARQQVDVSTLSSQITSLNTQQVALQLANSQLAAEKEVLVKSADSIRTEHTTLLQDQLTLRSLHEQLNAEYDSLNKEKEPLKTALRDLRIETRDLKEREIQLKCLIDELQKQLSLTRTENDNLGNLRAEHSKLKDDFRNLFTTSERLKTEYKNIQEQCKAIRMESGQLRLQNTKLTDELNTRSEQAMSVELEYTKCTQRCEMLLQMNANLDTDRRTLMDHVSQLLSQYHELLAHSLDDKQHYHDEEKQFTDKVNNLHRQKEKLEEKIMEHYKKLESCSPKKKTFGAGIMKRVKKASTDFINKVPSRNRRSFMLDDSRLTQSEITLGGIGGSESGGNESDNSLEDPHMMSDSAPPPMLQRNAHHRQSLQRRPTLDPPLMRSGMRSSFQSLRREDSVRSHRNSLHSMEPPDVTGSSLTLGTAGSRRTVYLLEENARKLADNNNSTSSTSINHPASAQTGSGITPEKPSNSASTGGAEAPPAAAAPPATFLMFNRISNVVGGTLEPVPDNNGASSSAAFADKNTDKPKDTKENGKESAVWYEYGCV